jgi:hypothetical protein
MRAAMFVCMLLLGEWLLPTKLLKADAAHSTSYVQVAVRTIAHTSEPWVSLGAETTSQASQPQCHSERRIQLPSTKCILPLHLKCFKDFKV